MKQNKLISQFKNLLVLGLFFPFIYGCNGGGGGAKSASLSPQIFDKSAAPAEFILALEPTEEINTFGVDWSVFEAETLEITGRNLVAVHNPEPATLLLFGFGTAAMVRRKLKFF